MQTGKQTVMARLARLAALMELYDELVESGAVVQAKATQVEFQAEAGFLAQQVVAMSESDGVLAAELAIQRAAVRSRFPAQQGRG